MAVLLCYRCSRAVSPGLAWSLGWRPVVAILILCAALLPPKVAAQNAPHRLSKDDVVKLLKGQVSPHRVSQRVREQGIDFEVTPEVESEMRQAGADDSLIAALRQAVPKAPALPEVPQSSGLRGVYVKTVVLSRDEAKRRFGLDDSTLRQDDQYTLIDRLEESSFAARADIHVGDYISFVLLGGDELGKANDVVHNESDFYRLAATCVPDCLLVITRGEGYPSGSKSGFLAVGQIGSNFELLSDSFSFFYRDKINQKRYGGLISADIIQKELETIRNGPHGSMSPVEPTPAPLGGQSAVTVQNKSSNYLTLILSGAGVRKLLVWPGGSETLKLPPGDYEIATEEMFSTQFGKCTYIPDMLYVIVYPQSALRGLKVVDIPKDVQNQFGPKGIVGVLVSAVETGTPADVAGIRPADLIQAVVTPEMNRTLASPADFDDLAAGCAPDCLLSVRHHTSGGYEKGMGYLPIGSVGSNFFPIYGRCTKRVIAFASKKGPRFAAESPNGSAVDTEDFKALLSMPVSRETRLLGGFITKNASCAPAASNPK